MCFHIDDIHYVGESLFMFLFHFEAVYLCNGVDAGSLDFSMSFLCGPDLILEAKPLRILSAILFFFNISSLQSVLSS